ncbi:MAG: ABC transporter ATP-binding protein [Longimonas sp.]|uniref:ABC transporter ATP-binding protein n=1 Tax=Longimonas sp. TaxID=2039626 RepID=UPI0033572581
MALLHLSDVRKSFAEGDTARTVLNGVHAEVDAGAFLVLMGRSGAGKSTLLNLVSGIDRPDAGVIRYNDTDLTTLSDAERTRFRREHIGFVFQSLNLIPTLTVAENIALPLELSGQSDEADARVSHLLERVGLPDRGDSYPDRLSGGEQQRVAIARALAHEPLLLLADEPTGSLDYETGRQVLSLLTDMVREHDTTLLIATHDESLADQADRTITLHNGTLHDGSLSALLSTHS